jgi:hypothetical protein
VAVPLCADAGLHAAATVAALTGVGAAPGELRRTMKQATIVNDEGERCCMFDDVDAAFRVGDRPPGLDVETAARLEQLDVDDVEHVDRAVSILRNDGQYRPNEIAQVLTYLGVARTDVSATHSSSSPSDRDADRRTASAASVPTDGDARDVLRYRVLEHETLIRRTVDEERNPARVAALSTGLGMSYRETIAACAQLGLDHTFTAQVAVTRRHGDIAQASADLAAGWTAPPPRDGWSTVLGPPPGHGEPDTATLPPGTADDAARAVLAQWRQAALSPPTPVMP